MRKFWPVWIIILVWLGFAFPYFVKDIIPFPTTYLVTRFAPWQYFYSMPVKNGAMPDVLSQLFPWRKLSVELLKKKEFPLWNPYMFSGTPHLANFQSASFHPLNFLFFFLSFATAWKILVLVQPLLAATFTYLFCRQINISPFGSLVSGLAFGFCGFIVVWMAYGTLGFALLWLPLILFGVEKVAQKPLSFSGLVISFGLAFSIFSGHFQISIYVLLATLAYLLFRGFQIRKPLFTVYCLLFTVLGLFLAAPQLLPSIEFYCLAPRSEIFLKGEVVPWKYLITLVAPDFFGNPVTRNDWFGHYAEWAGFIGVIPLILACYAVYRNRDKAIWFFAGLGILALLLALPTPLLDLLIKLKIPVVSTSSASRVICLFSFSAAILAGFGLDKLQKDWGERQVFKKIFWFFGIFTLFFLGVWLLLFVLKPLPADKLMVAKRNFILPTGMFFALAGLSFGVWLFTRRSARKRFLFSLFSFLFSLLIAFDLLRFAKKWIPTDPEGLLYPRLPVIEFLEKKAGFNRVFGNFGNELAVYFKIFSLEGYDPLYIRRYGEFITTAGDGRIKAPSRSTVYLDKNGEYTEKILSLLGVKYILHAKDDDRHIWAFPFWKYPDQFVEIYNDEKYQVFENKETLPRAFLIYDYVVEKDSQGIDRIYSLNLRETLVLEEEVNLKKGTATDLKGEVQIESYQPNEVLLSASTPKEGLLFLSDNFYPGWKAYLDGQETKVYRADYSFRAVKIPEGEHEVEFSYQPESFKWGLRISALTIVILLSCYLVSKIGLV